MGSGWTFEIYKSVGIFRDKWRWRLRAANHEIVAQGEAYKEKRDCVDIVNKMRDNMAYNVYSAGIEHLD